MNPVIENLTGMNTLTDQVVASDLLIAAKSGVKNLAVALTETTSPEVRASLTKQLSEAISFHGDISDYMIEAGYYHPYQMSEQIKLDVNQANTALQLPNV